MENSYSEKINGKGFTVIELVISILVLTFGVIGVFNAFSVMTILTSDSSDRLTGAYLAQEGMEIVRNIRDNNWLNMDTVYPATGTYSWLDGLSECSAGCEADLTSTHLLLTNGHFLFINPATSSGVNNFYNYSSGAATKFKRKITIAQVPDVDSKDDHIIRVTVQVSWKKKATILNDGSSSGDCDDSKGNCVTVQEILYDWYNYKNH